MADKREKKQRDSAKRRKAKNATRAAKRRKDAVTYMTLSGPIENFRQCRLEMLVGSPAGGQPIRIRAIIDTGATASAISADFAAKLSLPPVGKTLAAHAGGVDEVPVVAARCELRDGSGKSVIQVWPFGVLPGMTDELLFGMDLMRGGILTVDMVKGEWSLRLVRVGAPVMRPP